MNNEHAGEPILKLFYGSTKPSDSQTKICLGVNKTAGDSNKTVIIVMWVNKPIE